MDWQAYAQKIGLPSTGAMGDYYRPQIEAAMRNEQARAAAIGNQPGYQANVPGSLQGGNDMGGLMNAAGQAAGRMTQAQAQAQADAQQPSGQPTMYAGGSKGFDATGGQNPYAMPTQPLMPQTTMQHQAMPQQAQPSAGGSALPSYANSNPHMQGAMNSIQSQVTQNLTRNVLPQIGRNSVASGGYGGSRQGIAEGLAMGDAATAATNAMGNLAYQGFNADRAYGLNSDALDLSVFNANNAAGNQAFNNTLNAYDKMLGWNQNYGIGNATAVQNTPMNYWQQFANTGAQLGGLGGSQTQNLQGNPYLGALGGALTGAQLWKAWGG